ncbi:N-acetylmuramoyl-L-alanine amidase family protein [Simkania negevensis]|uniref:N-acetylmuramoyl-L-alanine amidase n=1 Tax=Simkania negevensis (strain ATCC VR-1471 / DSM 27360 / Z) TaxID=331113 RepID=F8L6M9_SIMNZ|nr:N-acetylmuramoyl-L-alanine amidase [Simkania negevensis]CCB88377.1 putative N-acetylmuramoyl-L-alanine amidase [Simkania negevensis Z]
MFLRTALFFIFLSSPLLTACSQNGKVDQDTPLAAAQNNARKGNGHLVVLDPGHGGFDIGAKSQNVEEKELALRTAMLVKRYLSSMGYRVILTRSRDVFIPLDKRTAIANDTKSKILVSLHYNAFKSSNAKGIEVYFYDRGSKWRSSNSKKLAQNVLSRLLTQTGAASRGVKHGNFHVVREANMPAILVEGGFITHPEERDRLADPKYLDRIAQGIAEGIDKYFH